VAQSWVTPDFSVILKVEGAEGNALGGDVQCAAKGEFAGTAVESFFGGDFGDIGVVVLLGEMRKNYITRACVKGIWISEKFADDLIRQVPAVAHHALLDVPGIWPGLELVEVVVGLDHEEINLSQMIFHMEWKASEVGNNCNFCSVGAKSESHRFICIMGNTERIDFDIADLESNASPNIFNPVNLSLFAGLLWIFGVHRDDLSMRWLGQIRGTIPLARHLREAARVIRMFMADEDPVNFFGARTAESFKAPQHFFSAQAGVNEKSRAPRLKQGAIARTARRQNGYTKRDTLPPRCASTTAIGCARHRNGMMAKCCAGVNTKSRKPH
jgi:hypothetical protein